MTVGRDSNLVGADEKVALVKHLIEQENPFAPITDLEIAGRLGLRRDQVTKIRNRAGVPTSRERLRKAVQDKVRSIIAETPSANIEVILKLLNADGCTLSRETLVPFIVATLSKTSSSGGSRVDSIQTKSISEQSEVNVRKSVSVCEYSSVSTLNELQSVPSDSTEEPFSCLLGSSGSLRPVIELAKAAMMYPPRGLHSLIVGPSGVGKTTLMQEMYRFYKVIHHDSKGIPFIVFNCADYADNPQLLLSQLFGHVKGAFTGADRDKEGVVEKANGGFLCLDEVHRLPPEGQEILFSIIDRGTFRRLGDVCERRVDVVILAATCEPPDSVLLTAFRRRIPVLIEFPPLSARPEAERMKLIENFFLREATRMGFVVEVPGDIIGKLLAYDCPGNIGQLSADIQVSCARAFVRSVTQGKDTVVVSNEDLPSHVRLHRLKDQKRGRHLGKLVLDPKERKGSFVGGTRELTRDEDLYDFIEMRWKQLTRTGVQANASEILRRELEIRVQSYVNKWAGLNYLKPEEFTRIVTPELFQTVSTMVDLARQKLGSLEEHVLYCLAVHLFYFLERQRSEPYVPYTHFMTATDERSDEYRVAVELAKIFEQSMGVVLPDNEVYFISLYLKSARVASKQEPRVGVVVASHGHVASAMVTVAQRLLGVDHGKYVDMGFEEAPEDVLPRLGETLKEADEGKGVLVLVDMGSLAAIAEQASQKYAVPIRIIERPDTLLVVEAIRRSILPGSGTTLDEVARMIGAERRIQSDRTSEKRCIVTLCITGCGTAVEMKNVIERELGGIGIDVIPMAAVDQEKLFRTFRQSRVLAVVGTVDPGIPSVPFIPAAEVLSGRGLVLLKNLLGIENARVSPSKSLSPSELDLLAFPRMPWSTRVEALESLCAILADKGFVGGNYVRDVLKRELLGSTAVQNGVAIPHALSSDVLRPCIAIATLEAPVDWGGIGVDVVIIPALQVIDVQKLQNLVAFIQNDDLMRRIRAALSEADIKEVFSVVMS